MAETYELRVWADGEVRNAEGWLLDPEGNPVGEPDTEDDPDTEETP